MSVLFGHPTGTPFSHHAALAHFEAGCLDNFCVPWMPSPFILQALSVISPLRSMTDRLSRRHFPELARAPKMEGRLGEFQRLLLRAIGRGNDSLTYEANEWLMRVMTRACHRPTVTAVHAYEDCSLWQFAEAKRLGKACIYDMPIGYYPSWQRIQYELERKYADWVPAASSGRVAECRINQKRAEMELADLVLVPSKFVETTIRSVYPEKSIALAPYGVDLAFWSFKEMVFEPERPLRFVYAGQLSLRKGTPLLIEAWLKADLPDAELLLVGPWQLAEQKRGVLPPNIKIEPPCSAAALRAHYQASDVFVFPSFFEGYGLVLTEAMACGLPAICSDATAGPEILCKNSGRVIPAGDINNLVENLRWFNQHRDQLPALSDCARRSAERCTWQRYRESVTAAVSGFV
jgi:glycosyltransferase involved in cell wall biosynthesis